MRVLVDGWLKREFLVVGDVLMILDAVVIRTIHLVFFRWERGGGEEVVAYVVSSSRLFSQFYTQRRGVVKGGNWGWIGVDGVR